MMRLRSHEQCVNLIEAVERLPQPADVKSVGEQGPLNSAGNRD